ncbi:hypothetical protein CYMTET_43220 [Cymbomonas tetramitiformis]|uniref:Rieske domain-containing protein n=1 Tax=Cymbomonas tetramitiformis TaxID=36881 RepID=A0AAE0C2L4_9CHLO|nr:hypothetical protein CYMTET_43220 [Cymbomonas tetramitiformis]
MQLKKPRQTAGTFKVRTPERRTLKIRSNIQPPDPARRSMKTLQSAHNNESRAIAIGMLEATESPFMIALTRATATAIISGLAFESFQIVTKIAGSLGPGISQLIQPNIVEDHLVALAVGSLMYSVEAHLITKFAGAAHSLEKSGAEDSKLAESDGEWEKTLSINVSTNSPNTSPKIHEEPSKISAVQRPPSKEDTSTPSTKEGSVDTRYIPNLQTTPGEWTHGFLADRHKKANDRRMYLKNFWYAAGLSTHVTKSKPAAVQMFGESLVLYRGEDNQVHCLSDVCPHRGAPLSGGWVEKKDGKNCIVCPYHGWAFDSDGRLLEVPANAAGETLPKRPLLGSYPIEERGGFVWLFWGSKSMPEDARPPIPLVPELEDPQWSASYGEFEFNAPYMPVFENAIDMAHIHYLHNGSFGNQGAPEISEIKAEIDAYGVTSTFSMQNKPPSVLWEFAKTPKVDVTAKALLPTTSVISFTLGAGISMITFVNTVPVSATKSINRFALVRNFAGWGGALADKVAVESMFDIFGEDKAMIEQLLPEQIIKEINVRADLPQLKYRQLRQSYLDMGYGVLPEMTQNGGADH